MKILVDTNVLISAALRDKLPEQVVLWIATGTTEPGWPPAKS
jgi:predicted nucleic acid-binding protein